MSSSHRGQTTGTLLGIAAIVMWGSLVGVARSVFEQTGMLWSAAAISLISGSLGLGIAALRSSGLAALQRLPGRYIAGCGFLFIVNNVSFYFALKMAANRVQVVEVGLVNYLWPALTLCLAVPILGKKARSSLLLGLLVAMTGIYLGMTAGKDVSLTMMVRHLSTNPTPYLLAFVGACAWALYSNLARRWAGSSDGGAVPLFLLATGLVLAIVAPLVEPFGATRWSPRALVELAYLVIFPTLLAYLFWDAAMRRGNLLLVSSLSFFTPLISTVISCAYLRVPMGLQWWIACGLVIVGAWICRRSYGKA